MDLTEYKQQLTNEIAGNLKVATQQKKKKQAKR